MQQPGEFDTPVPSQPELIRQATGEVRTGVQQEVDAWVERGSLGDEYGWDYFFPLSKAARTGDSSVVNFESMQDFLVIAFPAALA